MDIISKIDLLTDEITIGDVEQNKTKGNVDVIGGNKKCPEGQKW